MKCSLRERGQISFHIERSEIFHNMRVAYYFTFRDSKTFHLYAYHPTVHLRGVTHYTLQARCAKRSTSNVSRTPFAFSAGQNLLYRRHPKSLFLILRTLPSLIGIYHSDICYRFGLARYLIFGDLNSTHGPARLFIKRDLS